MGPDGYPRPPESVLARHSRGRRIDRRVTPPAKLSLCPTSGAPLEAPLTGQDTSRIRRGLRAGIGIHSQVRERSDLRAADAAQRWSIAKRCAADRGARRETASLEDDRGPGAAMQPSRLAAHRARDDGATARGLPRKIRKLRMLAQIIHHKPAAGDDLAAIGADQFQRALHQLRRNAAPAQRPRRLGMGDDDGARRAAIIRKRKRRPRRRARSGRGRCCRGRSWLPFLAHGM